MDTNNNTGSTNQILSETGGDIWLADLFLKAAHETAAKKDGYIPQSKIDEFYQELKPYKKKRDERFNQ